MIARAEAQNRPQDAPSGKAEAEDYVNRNVVTAEPRYRARHWSEILRNSSRCALLLCELESILVIWWFHGVLHRFSNSLILMHCFRGFRRS